MQLIGHSHLNQLKKLIDKIEKDNLFLLSSSTSYYSALAIAPFLMILLGVAGLIGTDIQNKVIEQANLMISPQVGQMISLIFKNVNEGVNFASFTGIVGIIVLLSTASLVFLQLRFSFDVIYGHSFTEVKKTNKAIVKERLFAMLVVIGVGFFFIFSFTVTALASKLIVHFGGRETLLTSLGIFLLNFTLYFFMFLGIHYFVPSIKPKLKDVAKISVITAFFFFLGNLVLASYLKRVAAGSIYGAAGTLFVFLIWSYYTTFTVFLCVEVFQHYKKTNKFI